MVSERTIHNSYDLESISRDGVWNKIVKFIKNHVFTKKFAKGILIGQCLSLLICGTAITSGLLEESSVNLPTGQSLINYLLLALTFTPWNLYRVGFSGYKEILEDRGWKYLVLGILEVEGNYFVIKAYQFTSVTSVQLLDCLAIPTVLILSKKFLKFNFKWSNYVGVLICLLGAGLLILADFLTDRHGASDPSQTVLQNLIGDLFCVLGAILYGILNISQEFVISKHGSIEYLGVVGISGSIVSAIQFAVLERQQLVNVDFTPLKVWLPFVLFSACLYAFYCLMSYGINKTSAMAINLNLLSSDFFSLLVGIVVFNYRFNVLYFGSFALIILGVLLYNIHPAKSPERLLTLTNDPSQPTDAVQHVDDDGPWPQNGNDDEESSLELRDKIRISSYL